MRNNDIAITTDHRGGYFLEFERLNDYGKKTGDKTEVILTRPDLVKLKESIEVYVK